MTEICMNCTYEYVWMSYKKYYSLLCYFSTIRKLHRKLLTHWDWYLDDFVLHNECYQHLLCWTYKEQLMNSLAYSQHVARRMIQALLSYAYKGSCFYPDKTLILIISISDLFSVSSILHNKMTVFFYVCYFSL